jgi:2-oxoglutarate/2-oxoacid ferredoxin oxidoreductase subunit alpha
MTETPLVLVDVQRGGPSTGLPTKVEQSDLLAALFGQPGDAPHVVLAPATIEECFHAMVTARRIAETFRMLVMVLTDANLATGVQPFRGRSRCRSGSRRRRPVAGAGRAAAVRLGPATGLSRRFIPGPAGRHAHDDGPGARRVEPVAYDTATNQRSSTMRSRKLAVLQQTLRRRW